MSGALTPVPLYACMLCAGTAFTIYHTLTEKILDDEHNSARNMVEAYNKLIIKQDFVH